ncbi:MAG: trypsin-like peptidase domain-containing protein [Clostridia bacterium]|nr:trypsin-like peptidase domain-containing protein [Clostridia bacterium]
MKKAFYKITTAIIVFTLVICMGGCTLFKNNYVPRDATLPSSTQSFNTVVFNTQQETRPVLTRPQAVAKVARSVVAIIMMQDDGVTARSYGSGVIVDIDNGLSTQNDNEFYVLTCHHVISAAGKIQIAVPDENLRNFTDENYNKDFLFSGQIGGNNPSGAVTLVGGDKKADVAVLKLDVTGTNVSASQIVECKTSVDGYKPLLGEDVFSIGNPSGELPMTVSQGIISYIDRAIEISNVGYMHLLQIDVQINKGNSGGGLFNMYGELVGITNAGNLSLDGINYAIPHKLTYNVNGEDLGFINIAKQLIATKTTNNYGWVSGRWMLGVTINNETLAIKSVDANSNAYGKLQENDVVQKISFTLDGQLNEISIENSTQLSNAFMLLQRYLKSGVNGDKFNITVNRNQSLITVEIQLEKEYIFCDTGISVVQP